MDSAFASSLIKYFELAAGITGVICYAQRKKSIWFVFGAYLIALFCMEVTGFWLIKQQLYRPHTYLYKFLVIPSLFCFYHGVFYQLLPKHKNKIIISGVFFLLIVFLENLLLESEHYFSISISIAYGAFAVVFAGITYLLTLVKTDDILLYKQKMAFWFCLALLVFYVSSFAKLTFFNSLGLANTSKIAVIYNWVFIILNYIMYTLFAFGFICSKPK